LTPSRSPRPGITGAAWTSAGTAPPACGARATRRRRSSTFTASTTKAPPNRSSTPRRAEPLIHSQAWVARGLWIPVRIDPAAKGRSQVDGTQLIELYRGYKLPLEPAINAVETGILDVFNKLSTGKLKVFKTCRNFFAEYRLYQRDEKGHVKKTKDHLMDCMRYSQAGGTGWWIARPLGWQEDGTIAPPDVTTHAYDEGQAGLGWMA
jgi:hypothetical protein